MSNQTKTKAESSAKSARQSADSSLHASPEALSAILTEYSELRQEIRNAQTKQSGMLSLYMTIIAAIFTAALQLYTHVQDNGSNILTPQAIAFVFIGILPLATAFMGINYHNEVYRQVKLSAYIYLLECKVNKAYPLVDAQTMDWERWVHGVEAKPFLKRVNNYNYYVSTCLFLAVGPVSILFGFMMLSFSFNLYVWISLGVTVIGYTFFLLFLVNYIRKFNELLRGVPTYQRKHL